MSNFVKTLLIFLIVWTFPFTVFSQILGETPDFVRRQQEEVNRQKREQDLTERRENLEKLNKDHLRSRREALNNARIPKFPAETAEQRAAIKEILTPNPEDLNKYKEFLQKSGTGIFRLFPDFDCIPEKKLIRVDGDCADLIPNTWFYSFRRKNYSDADYFDILFRDGNLISEGYLTQGILVRLGDVPIETVLLGSSGVKFLSDFIPETEIEKAKSRFAQISKGLQADGYRYASRIKAEENTTYALRVVAYRNENKTVNRLLANATANDRKFINLNYADKRIDLIVAFRIIRQDKNGSLSILWKILNRQDAPKIVFAKNEKVSDIKPNK